MLSPTGAGNCPPANAETPCAAAACVGSCRAFEMEKHVITRLIAIVIAGVTLTGYAPRWLATSDQAWIIWSVAAACVCLGPRLLRYSITSALRRAHIIRRPTVGTVR